MYSGGGSGFLKFSNGEYTYILFEALIKGDTFSERLDRAGVVVSKSGKRIAYLPCEGRRQSEMGPYEFEQIKIPRDPNEIDFEVP